MYRDKNRTVIDVVFAKAVHAPKLLPDQIFFASRDYVDASLSKRFHDVYVCGTFAGMNGKHDYYYRLGKYRGYLGRVSTEANTTSGVVETLEDYNATCGGVAIDAVYGQVIAGFEVETNLYRGFTLDIGGTRANPNPSTTNWNVAVVAFPYSRI